MKCTAPLALALFFVGAVSFAQQRKPQSLSYSDVQLKLGDNEKQTLERLRNRYAVNELPSDKFPDPKHTNYLVRKKDSDNNIVGVITFRNGKLVKAYRDWTPDDLSPHTLLLAIRGAIESIKEEGLCRLDTPSVREPNYLNESVQVICGNKYVEVSEIHAPGMPDNKGITIYEWLTDGTE